MCSAASLKAVDVGDPPPEVPSAIEDPALTHRQLSLLTPFFRNALWYYEAYFVYVEYSNELEDLNAAQGEEIDYLLEKEKSRKFKDFCLITITAVSATAATVLAIILRGAL